MIRLTTLLILSLIITSSGKKALPSQPNIIVFIADDVSWDDFGCYGNPYVKTPNIDKLAANGLKFNNFYLTASSCSPSRNSIMTGRYPHNTGAPELHQQPPDSLLSFAEILKNSGYYSVQAGKFHMGPYARRGFDITYDDRKTFGDGGELQWVKSINERPKDRPFFMWFAAIDAHRSWGPNDFSGTHTPKSIVPPFYLDSGQQTKEDLAKYYDEIHRFDHYIGEVVAELKAQKALDNTVIMIMADNGRPFPHSKTRVNDRGMKTPFIIHWPDAIKKMPDCNGLISAIDIAPTILQLAGIKAPSQFQGTSFESLITEPEKEFRNHVFAEHNWHDYEAHERMVRLKDFMYIRNARPNLPLMGPADAVGSPSHQDLVTLKNNGQLSEIQADVFKVPRAYEELFDCKKDPEQLLNLAAKPEYGEKLEEMRKALNTWIEVTNDNVPENLTHDWYTHKPGYERTEQHGIRGDTPGTKSATTTTESGPF